jgi:hypothetical protein
MRGALEEAVERVRKEQPSLDEQLEDYRRRKREYDESRGGKPEREPAWRKPATERNYRV